MPVSLNLETKVPLQKLEDSAEVVLISGSVRGALAEKDREGRKKGRRSEVLLEVTQH